MAITEAGVIQDYIPALSTTSVLLLAVVQSQELNALADPEEVDPLKQVWHTVGLVELYLWHLAIKVVTQVGKSFSSFTTFDFLVQSQVV